MFCKLNWHVSIVVADLQLDSQYLKKHKLQWNSPIPYPPCKITVSIDRSPIFVISRNDLLGPEHFLCDIKLQYLVSTYQQLDCLSLETQKIQFETLSWPYPPCKHYSQYWQRSHFFQWSSTTFCTKMHFFYVHLQYLVSTYLQLDCLYLNKRNLQWRHFVTLPPMSNYSQFGQKSNLLATSSSTIFAKTFFVC